MSTLTETLRSNLNNPVSSPEFDLYTALDKVLSGVGLSAVPRYSNGFDIEHSIYEKEGEVSAQ